MSFMEAAEPTTDSGQASGEAPRLCDIFEDGTVISPADFTAVGNEHPEWVDRGNTVDSITCQHCGACAIANMRFRHEPPAPPVPRPRREAA